MNHYHRFAAAVASVVVMLVPRATYAHCPLCTVGAIALGIGAYELGVSTFSVGIAIGASAAALGLWMAALVRRRYIPQQKAVLAILIFATTIIPVVPFMPGAFGLYLPSIGVYGTTLVVSRFLSGSLLGGALVVFAPFVSAALSKLAHGKRVPFQGVVITLGLLLVAIVASEIIL